MIELLTGFCIPGTHDRSATEAVTEYVEAYNAHDLTRVRAVFTVDARVGNGSSLLTGEQLLSNYETILFARFPEARVAPDESLKSGDIVAQTETVTGIDAAESGLSSYRVDQGCIVEMSISR